MLKHVTYRSTSSLGRMPSDLTCRGSSVTPDTVSLKGNLISPELPLKSSSSLLSPDTISLKDDTLSLKVDMSRGSYASPDTISLHSTLSFSSLATGRLSSRCSSTTSLDDQPTTPVKIYLRSLRPDMEYKTVRLSSEATCRQLVLTLLAKFRLRHRDPNLFFVTMEVVVRAPGGGAPARRLLVLDDHARPAELQQCRPRGDARFSVGVRRGGLVRVHDSVLMAGSQYKSLLVSFRTTASEVVQLLLSCYNSKDSPAHYALHEVNKNPYSDRRLRHEECPLLVMSEWPRGARPNLSFVLRRDLAYTLALTSRLTWRRSLDQSSTDTESEHEDHNTTLASLASALSTSSHGSLSSSASVASSASMASDASSSSGISSSSSPGASPAPSPAKTKSLSSLIQSLETRLTSKPPICAPRLPHPFPPHTPLSVAPPTVTLPATRTTSLPPTPVPRTILGTTSNSTLKSKSLPALRGPVESQCRSTTSATILSSSKAASPSTSSLSPSTPSSLSSSTTSSPSPSIATLLPSSTSLSTSTVSLGSNVSSTSLCPSTSTSSISLSSSIVSLPSSTTSSSTISSSIISSSTTSPVSHSPLVVPSSTCSSPSRTQFKEDIRPPPLPVRRSSCCRHYENCFYI